MPIATVVGAADAGHDVDGGPRLDGDALDALSGRGNVGTTSMAVGMSQAMAPESEFLDDHAASASAFGLKRNSSQHWTVHWYVQSRWRPTTPVGKRRPYTLRGRLHAVLDGNKPLNFFLLFLIVLSTTCDVVETEFTKGAAEVVAHSNASAHDVDDAASAIEAFRVIEVTCMIIFSLEFVLRLLSAPSLVTYVRTPFNWLDAVAVIPWWFTGVLAYGGGAAGIGDISATFRLVRLVRAVRLLKFGVYSSSVRIFFLTIDRSLASLIALCTIGTVVLLIYATLLFFAESDVPPEDRTDRCGAPCYSSILSCSWTVINTLTSCGYVRARLRPPRPLWPSCLLPTPQYECCVCLPLKPRALTGR